MSMYYNTLTILCVLYVESVNGYTQVQYNLVLSHETRCLMSLSMFGVLTTRYLTCNFM